MTTDLLELALQYHEWMPLRIREYLHERGIADFVIDRYLVGWSGWRITIPIYDRQGVVRFFKLVKDPADPGDSAMVLGVPDAPAELYGWEHVEMAAGQVIVCDSELNRLLLESRGYAAIASTGGPDVFRKEWANALHTIGQVYVCFANGDAARGDAARVVRLIPRSKIVLLPRQVGNEGGVAEFFLALNRTTQDFDELLEAARPIRGRARGLARNGECPTQVQ